MIQIIFLNIFLAALSSFKADTSKVTPPLVSYEDYASLIDEVRKHREERLINLDQFNAMSKEENTIILDTRSNSFYKSKHIKGAINLDFTEFNVRSVARVIPNANTRILIYCNNNILDDDASFPSKIYIPPATVNEKSKRMLALNIPTYLNLYGYGYKNVYELNEGISWKDRRVEMVGSSLFRSWSKGQKG
jgi:hypothetical protein